MRGFVEDYNFDECHTNGSAGKKGKAPGDSSQSSLFSLKQSFQQEYGYVKMKE
jgi:hypothetical protein